MNYVNYENADDLMNGIKDRIDRVLIIARKEVSPSEHDYTEGQWISYSNSIYRVKADIEVGDPLVVDTNIEIPDSYPENAEFLWEDDMPMPGKIISVDSALSTTSENPVQNKVITNALNNLGTASTKDFTDLVRPNSHDLVESGSVYSAINNALASIYTPRGELTCAELTSSLLIEENVGNVYQMSDSGTTTSLFINGAGISISVNDNVGVIKAGQNTYMFNYMGNAFDLHDYQKKDLETPVVGETTVEGALGGLDTKETDDVQDVYEVMGKNGAKNLNSYPYAYTTREINGITFTDNGDGTVTANGTATADAQFNFHERTISGENKLILKNGNYTISGCPEGGSTSKYYINANMTKNGTATVLGTDIGEGAEIVLNGDDFSQDNVHMGFFVKIKSGQTVSNLVFKPMIRYAEDTDNTYVPYAPTNRDLVSWKVNGKLGTKNLLPYPYQAGTVTNGGVTFTDNGDGSITVNGTAGENGAYYNCHNRTQGENNEFILPNGKYIVSGCPSDGSPSSYQIQVGRTHNGMFDLIARDTGNGAMFIANGDDFSDKEINPAVNIIIMRNTTVNNLTFYPMLRYAEDTDSTYVPYSKTNRELTIDKAEQTEVNDIVNVYGAKNLLPYPYYSTTKTQNGVTFTDNGDGTVTVNGTATDGVVFFCSIRGENGKCILPNGTYIVTGCPNGGAVSSYKIGASRITGGSGTTYGTDVGNGLTITLDGDDFGDDDVRLQIGIAVSSGTVCNNLLFKPMVRLASIKDDTYVPYVPTNAKLDEEKVSWDDASESVQKNLNSYPYVETTKTSNGITFTDLGDGTIKVNGTATADAVINCHIRAIGTTHPLFIPNGKYVISGCPSGGSSSTYLLGVAITKNGSASTLALDYGNGREFTLNGDDTYTDKVQLQIQIFVKNGTTVNNLVFKPMLRKATIKDDTWQPYIPNNKELVSWKSNGVLGAKNLLPYPYNSTTGVTADVTYTDNGDGTFTASGTADGLSDKVLYTRGTAGFKLKAGTYILSGAPQGSSDSTYSIYVRGTGSSAVAYMDYGEGVQFTLNADEDNMGLYLRVRSGQTVSNLVFKPMLRLASDPDSTYQPYAMTNRELTDKVIKSGTITSGINTNGYLNETLQQSVNVISVISQNNSQTARFVVSDDGGRYAIQILNGTSNTPVTSGTATVIYYYI